MGLFIPDIPCLICQKPIGKDEEKICFSPFVINKVDPLWMFSDGVFHAKCIQNHPLGIKALRLHDIFQAKISALHGEMNRTGLPQFNAGLIVSDEHDPLYKYNFIQINLGKVVDWSEREMLVNLLSQAIISKHIQGEGCSWLLNQLKKVS
jgi:hypothetical protein